MIALVALAVALAGFAAGFVVGTAYGVYSERANEAERLARRARYR